LIVFIFKIKPICQTGQYVTVIMTFFDHSKKFIYLSRRNAAKAIHALNKKLSPKDPTQLNSYLVHEIYENARSMDLTDTDEQMLIYYLFYLMKIFRHSEWIRGKQLFQPVFLETDRFAFWADKKYPVFLEWYNKFKRDTTNLKGKIESVDTKLFDLIKIGIVVKPIKVRVEDEDEDEDEPQPKRKKRIRWRDEEGKGELAEVREFNIVIPQGELDTIFPPSRLRTSHITLVSQRRSTELKKKKRELASTVDPRVLRKEYTPLELMIEITKRKEAEKGGKKELKKKKKQRKKETHKIVKKLKKSPFAKRRKDAVDVLKEIKEFRTGYQKVVHMREEQQEILTKGREEEDETYNKMRTLSIVETSNKIHIELLIAFDKWVKRHFAKKSVSVFDIYKNLKQLPEYHSNELFFKTLVEFLYPMSDMWRIWHAGYKLGKISETRYKPGDYKILNDFIILWEAMEETSVVHGSSANRKILLGLDNFVLGFFSRGEFDTDGDIKVETLKSQIEKSDLYDMYHGMIDRYIISNTVTKGIQGDEFYKPLNYKNMNKFLSGWYIKSEPGIDDEVQKLLDEMGSKIARREEEEEDIDEGGDELESFEEQLSREVLEQTTFRYGTKKQKKILREYNNWMEGQFETVADVFFKDILHAVEVRKKDTLERRDAWIFDDLQSWIRRKVLNQIQGVDNEDIERQKKERMATITVRELFYLLDTKEDDKEEKDMYIDTVREWAEKYFILRNKVDIRILRGSTRRNYEKYEENKEFLDEFLKYLEETGKKLYMYYDFEVMNQFLRGRGDVITKIKEMREKRQQKREIEEQKMDKFDRDLKLKADEQLKKIKKVIGIDQFLGLDVCDVAKYRVRMD